MSAWEAFHPCLPVVPLTVIVYGLIFVAFCCVFQLYFIVTEGEKSGRDRKDDLQ